MSKLDPAQEKDVTPDQEDTEESQEVEYVPSNFNRIMSVARVLLTWRE